MPTYRERDNAQDPALELLTTLGDLPGVAKGYTYLSHQEALAARDGSASRVLLTGVLQRQLRAINEIEYKGETYAYSDQNIYAAVEALRSVPDRGVVPTNEDVYDLLTLGKGLEQTIRGDRKSFQLQYIDFEHPERNVYHVTDEFEVEGLNATRYPDLVLFVNGIPLVVIECKRRDKDDATEQAMSQMLRNQTREEGVPRLFHYAQLVLAAQPNEVKYATAGTPRKFWSYWKEEGGETCSGLGDLTGRLASRLPTEQDGVLYALCRPERLLELTYQFVVFDAGSKKVARWQQYFTVKNTLQRVKQRQRGEDRQPGQARRKGGVVWHTQGSGKSLTMVLLAKALALDPDIENPRVAIVTDRVDLDEQIWKTFRACGKEPVQATDGRHLLKLLRNPGSAVITTLVNKFDTALDAAPEGYRNASENIFLLIDEVHRTQHGSLHARMRKALPNACAIGFTGTPLTKKEKNTARKFGGFIDPTYTIRQAVDDEAVVPLLYEGRLVGQTVYEKPMDRDYDRVTEPLSGEQKEDLARKFSTEEAVFASEQNIREVVYDITEHFTETWQGTGLKGQIAAPSKDVAVRMHEMFEEDGKVQSAVVISPPDLREGYEDIHSAPKERELRFWKGMMERYGSRENYEKSIITNFKSQADGRAVIELLIVVDKLLTGFDAPRDTVLYVAKKMRSHTLLQAIARVNRPFPGKDFGYVLDYRGILGALSRALTEYEALAEFDGVDLEGALHNISEEVENLPGKHAQVWQLFKGVDESDNEAMEQHLGEEKIREDFYERLSAFARTFQLALSSEHFHQTTDEEKIERYRSDLHFFQSLRRSVRQRYNETVNLDEFEPRIKKLIDRHVAVESVEEVVGTVDILDDGFDQEVERMTGTKASKADAIASRLAAVATERMDEDPAFYEPLSERIKEVIQNFRKKHLKASSEEADQYYDDVMAIRDEMQRGGEGAPPALQGHRKARAYYGTLRGVLSDRNGAAPCSVSIDKEKLAQAGLDIDRIVSDLQIVDWHRNPDVKKDMRNEVEDYLLDLSRGAGLDLSFDEIDHILEQTLQIARSRRDR